MSKILVTGGLGTVGLVLANELIKRGNDVWIMDMKHHSYEKYIRGDISSFMTMSRVFDEHEFDFVYNLAAEFGRWNGEDFYDTLWTSNAIGTKNIIRMQEKYKFKLIHFSSSEVYGDWDKTMQEDVMINNHIRQMNDYAISKWVNEMQIMNSADMFGTESVRIRLFNTYGPGEYYSSYRSVVCRFVYCAIMDLPYTVFLDHTRTSTYVSDMVNTIANISENFVPGEVYNIGGLDYHDIKDLSDLILKHAGKTDKLVTYKEAEPFTTRHKIVDCTRAVRDLKHEPKVMLDEGIEKTVKWMSDVYLKNRYDLGNLDLYL